VIASVAEGMFGNVTRLMDKAVQLVKAVEEADNYVRDHYLATRDTLIRGGYSTEDAERRAGVRIFDEPPGIYNLNTARIVEASGTWDTDLGIANDYMKKMGHGFGNGFWGEPMEDVFRLALSGTEKVVHSSSTALYGALDNDDFYMYMGGLATAIRSIDGASPELVVTNTRDPGKPQMTSIDEFIGLEFRSRYVNPTWIEGMKKEGYAGAGEMRKFVEYLWGWDATVTETVDDAMWNEAFEVYVEDKHGLELEQFFAAESPFAYQDLTARMIETIRKGYWAADDATKRALLEKYIESVNEHGAGCSDHTCGNPRFIDYVVDEAATAGIPAPAVASFAAAIERMVGGGIEERVAEAAEFVVANEARVAARQAAAARGRIPDAVEGYLMEDVEQPAEPAAASERPATVADVETASTVVFAALLLALLAWWRSRRQVAV
jgi:cobaltochelatase CobN